jgi:aryl-alcohol dehydrogenase-like predicted oxidoreductase
MVRRLCLGTAKLGMPWYGLGSTSRPTHADSASILREAVARGITHFDTGRAYGDAEDLVAHYLPGDVHVSTKTAPDLWRYVHMHDNHWTPLLLHNPTVDQIRFYGRTVDGASVYTPEEAQAVVDAGMRHLQVPFCVFDQRHRHVIERAVAVGLTVYARQPFLQGILTADVARPGWPIPEGWFEVWRTTCETATVPPLEAALRFALETPAHFIVFGVGSVTHLREVIRVATSDPSPGWGDLSVTLRRMFPQAGVQLGSLWRP